MLGSYSVAMVEEKQLSQTIAASILSTPVVPIVSTKY